MGLRIASDEGQATVEHVGLMALIAAILAVAMAAAAGASPAFRNSVRGAFEHALCIVTGEECGVLAREPCPTLRTVKVTSQGVAISVVRIGHDRTLVIERRSDGSYVMTLMEGSQAGAGVADGVTSGKTSLSGEASVIAGGRAGRTYEAATPEEAKALVERLRGQRLPATAAVVTGAADLAGLLQADPSVTSYVLAGDSAIEMLGRFGLGGMLGGGGKAKQRREIGVKISARDEEITAYTTLDQRAGVFFDAMSEVAAGGGRSKGASPAAGAKDGGVDLSKSPAGRSGTTGAADERARVTVKNPLVQKYEGELVGGGSIALRFGPGAKLLGIEVIGYLGTGGEQKEIRARLDPSDPDVRAAYERWREDPTSPEGLGNLGRVAADRSAVDVRTFKTKSSEHAHGGQIAVRGHALGLGFGSQGLVSELVEQRSRPAGGEWENRTDCVTPVA